MSGRKCPFAPGESLAVLAKTQCPAFSGGCPFSAATTRKEIQRALEHMPRSHSDPTSSTRGVVAGAVETHAFSELDRAAGLVDEWVGWWSAHASNTSGGLAASALTPARGGLARQLREGTAAAHADAERVAFVRLLLQGKAPLEAYLSLLAALARIYGALEAAAARTAPETPAVDAVCGGGILDALRRAVALRCDLAFYSARDPDAAAIAEAFAAASPATAAYVAKLESFPAAGAAAEVLIAHLYTRYLGDLSGGQTLRRAIVRAYDLVPSGGTTLDAAQGVAFYDFPAIGAATCLRHFKDDYRTALDALHVADTSAVVAEAIDAFCRNTAILKELDLVVLGATDTTRYAQFAARPMVACRFLAQRRGATDLASSTICPVTAKEIVAVPVMRVKTAVANAFPLARLAALLVSILVGLSFYPTSTRGYWHSSSRMTS